MLEKSDPLAKAPLTSERLVTSDLSVPLKPPAKPNAAKRVVKTIWRASTESFVGTVAIVGIITGLTVFITAEFTSTPDRSLPTTAEQVSDTETKAP